MMRWRRLLVVILLACLLTGPGGLRADGFTDGENASSEAADAVEPGANATQVAQERAGYVTVTVIVCVVRFTGGGAMGASEKSLAEVARAMVQTLWERLGAILQALAKLHGGSLTGTPSGTSDDTAGGTDVAVTPAEPINIDPLTGLATDDLLSGGEGAKDPKKAKDEEPKKTKKQLEEERKRAKIVSTARAQLGKRYVWGAAGPNTFDCSGLVMFCYKKIGKSLPHYSHSQAKLGKAVSRKNLEPGDIVCFYDNGHVGIYIGKGKYIHAPGTGDHVKISSLSDCKLSAARSLLG